MPAWSGGYLQKEFPYRDLVETIGRRSKDEFEYVLLDTGVFDEDRSSMCSSGYATEDQTTS